MTEFEPFDSEYEIDKSVLSDQLEDYLRPSTDRWLRATMNSHTLVQISRGKLVLKEAAFLHPLQETFRRQFPAELNTFVTSMFSDIKLFRNLLSYILQNVATVSEARDLEEILARCSSAYAVEFIRDTDPQSGIFTTDGKPFYKIIGTKLTYRVPLIVKIQAEEVFATESLFAEAWEFYYGMSPDDEKTVVRATDALAGAIRDVFFPEEKRPVFGTLLNKLKQDPASYPMLANSIYDQKKFLETMDQFSKIRGNHQKGTGRKPTHEEAGFVLHFAIMFYQILRSTQ